MVNIPEGELVVKTSRYQNLGLLQGREAVGVQRAQGLGDPARSPLPEREVSSEHPFLFAA